jgi:hypothetical protein
VKVSRDYWSRQTGAYRLRPALAPLALIIRARGDPFAGAGFATKIKFGFADNRVAIELPTVGGDRLDAIAFANDIKGNLPLLVFAIFDVDLG